MKINQIRIVPAMGGMQDLGQGVGIVLQVQAFLPENLASFCGSRVAQLGGVQQLLLQICIERGKVIAGRGKL